MRALVNQLQTVVAWPVQALAHMNEEDACLHDEVFGTAFGTEQQCAQQDGDKRGWGQKRGQKRSVSPNVPSEYEDGEADDESDESSHGQETERHGDEEEDGHDEKRLRKKRGFVPDRSLPNAETTHCPTLLSASLTKHSAKFSPPLYLDGQSVANMDHYRDCMLLDKHPDETGLHWYTWVSATHDNCYYDGSDMVFYRRVLDVLDKMPDDSDAVRAIASVKACMIRLTQGRWEENEYGDVEESVEWLDTSTRMRIKVHVPLMKLQPSIDMRYEEEAQRSDRSLIFTTETGDLIIGTARYRHDHKSILLATQLCIEYKEDDHHDQRLTFCYEDGVSKMKLARVHCDKNDSEEEVLLHTLVSPDATRSLLCLQEYNESELTHARLEHAPRYVLPVWPALVAASCRKKPLDHELWVSLLIRHVGDKMRHDTPNAEEGMPTTWVWSMEDLWHNNEAAVRTNLKAAATEMCDLVSALPGKKVYGDVLLYAHKEYQSHLPKKESDGNGDADDEDAGGERKEEGEDGGEGEGDEEDEGWAGEGEEGDEEDEGGAGEGEPISPALAKIVKDGDIDLQSIYFRLHAKSFSVQMSNNNRFLEARVSTLLPWISERGFATSFQETMSVAWKNGVQDFFRPYAWHQPTPLDRVCSRLPYELADDPATPEDIAALEKFVISERYQELLFNDRAVALREADKDAIMFLGDPSVMAEANIRVHVGPYDKSTNSFGSRCGKNLRLTMLKSVYCHLLDDAKGAGFLSHAMVPGKAYSMFSGIEFKLGMWVDEAQNASVSQLKLGSNGMQPWNPGLVLKLAPGSERSTFQYRVEHGKEKTVKLKLQAINVSSNKINIPNNPGFASKTEASPYPRIGKSTQEEVDQSCKPAFLIRKECIDFVKKGRGVLARYFVNRALAITKDARSAHPRTQKHMEATETILSITGIDNSLCSGEANAQLSEFADDWLHPCDGQSHGSKGKLMDLSEDHVDWPKRFQTGGGHRCYCTGKPTGKACHFTVSAFATRLESHKPHVFEYFVKRANQTAILTTQLQRALGLEDLLHLKKANAYPRGAIFGWTLREQHTTEEDEAVNREPVAAATTQGVGPSCSSDQPVQLEIARAPPLPFTLESMKSRVRQTTFTRTSSSRSD